MVLITGGFGYLGGRIANYLRKSGNTLRIGTSRANTDSQDGQSLYEIVKINLFDDVIFTPISIWQLMEEVKFLIEENKINSEIFRAILT